MLETIGGFAEVARRISDTFRRHYTVVDFLIPSHAMSAGTILAMSGDAIHMDYYSVLGPIDLKSRIKRRRLIPRSDISSDTRTCWKRQIRETLQRQS